ncbi:hypothetical protein ADK67_04880 [Saccharothrix sp. NRRL B-16348]|uniref:hypothetical protein n=1 Tax=Saccharothrix sp. NRRL B-16348 TaxID=1415542 RepID=UPI0006AFD557|nr:hypothetical protein [Saccharothrix sp. NRRL B-16348]KOX33950.1 hypothetical protein ADK67_04880 [Saccharothrix sp. NRRL B-16348]
MDTQIATPQAVRDFIDARNALFRAIDFDHARGVSANEIARMATPAISRPIVLSYLTAKQLHTDALNALRTARLEGPFGIAITGQIGRGSRTVHLALTYDPQEIEEKPDTLVTRATDALRAAGIDIRLPEGWNSVTDALWDGEPVPLHRT